jgi:serine/threonine protein kinase
VDQTGTIVKVTDFGASKNFNEDALTTKIGTPNYLAPEIYLGMNLLMYSLNFTHKLASGQQYGPAVDIWSLGVISMLFIVCFIVVVVVFFF